jgi:hypothetical protein
VVVRDGLKVGYASELGVGGVPVLFLAAELGQRPETRKFSKKKRRTVQMATTKGQRHTLAIMQIEKSIKSVWRSMPTLPNKSEGRLFKTDLNSFEVRWPNEQIAFFTLPVFITVFP